MTWEEKKPERRHIPMFVGIKPWLFSQGIFFGMLRLHPAKTGRPRKGGNEGSSQKIQGMREWTWTMKMYFGSISSILASCTRQNIHPLSISWLVGLGSFEKNSSRIMARVCTGQNDSFYCFGEKSAQFFHESLWKVRVCEELWVFGECCFLT